MGWVGLSPKRDWADLGPTNLSFYVWARPDPDIWAGPEPAWPRKQTGWAREENKHLHWARIRLAQQQN